MRVVLGAEEAAFGVPDLAEVEFDEVFSLEFAGGLDGAGPVGA